MKRNTVKLVVLTLSFFLLTAARTAPIHNVENAEIGAKLKLEDIKKSILRAGMSLGWNMKPDKPGHILATLLIRSHTAVVDITYDEKTFSIKYKDSVNLNQTGDLIHRNYNNWILNLEKHIKMQLLTA